MIGIQNKQAFYALHVIDLDHFSSSNKLFRTLKKEGAPTPSLSDQAETAIKVDFLFNASIISSNAFN